MKVSSNSYIYIKIEKGIPGLKQAALLACEHLKNSLAPHEYYPILGTIRLQKCKTRLTKFCLHADDFGIKFQSKEDADYLYNAIRVNFKYINNKEGKDYYSLILDQNYNLRHVDISMPKYILETLKKLLHQLKVYP